MVLKLPFSCDAKCSCQLENDKAVTRWTFNHNECMEDDPYDFRCNEDKEIPNDDDDEEDNNDSDFD